MKGLNNSNWHIEEYIQASVWRIECLNEIMFWKECSVFVTSCKCIECKHFKNVCDIFFLTLVHVFPFCFIFTAFYWFLHSMVLLLFFFLFFKCFPCTNIVSAMLLFLPALVFDKQYARTHWEKWNNREQTNQKMNEWHEIEKSRGLLSGRKLIFCFTKNTRKNQSVIHFVRFYCVSTSMWMCALGTTYITLSFQLKLHYRRVNTFFHHQMFFSRTHTSACSCVFSSTI